MLQRHPQFAIVLALYLLIGIAYAIRTPDWQAPDEPAHYNYIRQLAAGDLPLMAEGDYDSDYQGTVISSRFDPQYSIDDIEYEDYQPPLYYMLLTPSYWLGGGQLELLRITSILLGAGVVFLAYRIGLHLFPDRQWIALTAAIFVAFLPQHLAILSSINNDALAELLVAAMLFVLVRNWRNGAAQFPLTLSLLLGLAFLTKVTAYLMAGAIGVVLLWQFWGDWRTLIQTGLRVFVPAALIGLFWWGRNIVTYGGLDFLGTQAHDRVVEGQLTTQEYIELIGRNEAITNFFYNSARSFVGQFGWMAAPFQTRLYYLPFALLVVSIVGLIGLLIRKRGMVSAERQYQIIIFSSLALLNILLLVTYNLLFVQHQGRYLFVSLIPFGIALAVGLGAWVTWIIPRDSKILYLIPAGLGGYLIFLNFIALSQILPCLAPFAC